MLSKWSKSVISSFSVSSKIRRFRGKRCFLAAAKVARTQFSGRYMAPGRKLMDRAASVSPIPSRLASSIAFTGMTGRRRSG